MQCLLGLSLGPMAAIRTILPRSARLPNLKGDNIGHKSGSQPAHQITEAMTRLPFPLLLTPGADSCLALVLALLEGPVVLHDLQGK